MKTKNKHDIEENMIYIELKGGTKGPGLLAANKRKPVIRKKKSGEIRMRKVLNQAG